MVMVPLSMVSSRLMHRHTVDLPEPEGPMTTTTSPACTVSSMSLSTCRSPKCLSTWSITTRGRPCGGSPRGAAGATSSALAVLMRLEPRGSDHAVGRGDLRP